MVGGRLPRGSQLGFCQPFPRLGEWRTWASPMCDKPADSPR